MKKFLKENKNLMLIIFSIIIVIIIGLLIYKNNNEKTYEIHETSYSIKYNKTWKKVKEDDTEIKLLHKKSNSQLNIKINELEDEFQYKTLDEIFNNLLYNVQEQNKSYKLIYRQKTTITKDDIEGYEILFEKENKQVVIYFYKQGKKIVVFTYEAEHDYFDIILDNVKNIIYSFNLNEQKFDVITSINLDTKQITYSQQEDIVNLLTGTKEENIASSNYSVNYLIPNNFKLIDYDTESGSYSFENLSIGTTINLKTNILKCNLYEYLNKENSINIYNNYNLNLYSKESEQLDKFGDEPLAYIYKNSYLSSNQITENIVLIFELNNNHILTVKIASQGIGIPEELVKMIKINNVENIASNVKIEKDQGFLIGKLKRFVDYTYEKIEEITLKLPENYQEIDKATNLYEERNYVLNYNEDKENYEYELTYKTTPLDIEGQLNILKNTIANDFVQNKDIVSNNKNFKVYTREYINSNNKQNDSKSYHTNEKILFYQLQNESYLAIIIKANDNKITDELINQITNFNVSI